MTGDSANVERLRQFAANDDGLDCIFLQEFVHASLDAAARSLSSRLLV